MRLSLWQPCVYSSRCAYPDQSPAAKTIFFEGGAISADMQHRNVELTPAAADNAATEASASGAGGGGGRNMQPGRITATMSQDLHPIQGPIREVATATGGRTIRRSGDLAAALNGIVEDGHATYQLSFSPQAPADDQSHPLH